MESLRVMLIATVLALGACSSEDGPIIAGGPTRQEARQAVLNNSSIWPSQASAEAKEAVKTMRIETMHCVSPSAGYVECDVRLYTKAMGWSAPTPGRFTNSGGYWSFFY